MSQPPPISDTIQLLRQAKAGDRASLHELVERYRQRLLDRIRLMMGPEARLVAESGDFLQGVMVEIAAGLPDFDLRDHQAFLRWATSVARNNIKDAVKKRREKRLADFAETTFGSGLVDPRGADAAAGAHARDMMERLIDALVTLGADHQMVIELRDFEGLSFQKIGEQMQRSDNAAQLLHTRALIELGRAVQGLHEGAEQCHG